MIFYSDFLLWILILAVIYWAPISGRHWVKYTLFYFSESPRPLQPTYGVNSRIISILQTGRKFSSERWSDLPKPHISSEWQNWLNFFSKFTICFSGFIIRFFDISKIWHFNNALTQNSSSAIFKISRMLELHSIIHEVWLRFRAYA